VLHAVRARRLVSLLGVGTASVEGLTLAGAERAQLARGMVCEPVLICAGMSLNTGDLDRDVALKVLPTELALDPERVARSGVRRRSLPR
jgi:hypothetical protein